MDRTAALAKLTEHQTELRQLGVEHLYLCGSTARAKAREDSDVDLFFDHPTLWGLLGFSTCGEGGRRQNPWPQN
jgi:predicted nucleotidyltransferase